VVWAPRLHGEPGGPTSITGTARFVPTTFYIASLPFQDALQNGGYTRVLSLWINHALRSASDTKAAGAAAPRVRA